MKAFKDALGELKKSSTFKAWMKKNSKCYLSYGFFVIDNEDTHWKIGYYDKSKDRVTSFDVGKSIKIEPDEEIFKKDKKAVRKLHPKNIKLDLADAVALANSIQKEEFANENPIKIIAVLQNIEKNEVWNLTFLTQNFNTLNFKIKADTGRVIDKKLVSLMQFGTPLKGTQ